MARRVSRAARRASGGAGVMTDRETTIAQLKDLVLRFSRERDWEKFHHPKDLGVALACEVGEVLEYVRYRTNEQVRDALSDPARLVEFGHELADCLWVLLRLSDVCGIDLAAALEEKVDLAAQKYPIERSFGRPDKYTAYRDPAG